MTRSLILIEFLLQSEHMIGYYEILVVKWGSSPEVIVIINFFNSFIREHYEA